MEQNPTIKGTYTIPEISISNPQDWFIYFRLTHNGKEYLRKYREGLNRIKDKSERMTQVKQLCQLYKEWLEKDWNPIIDPEFKVRHIKPIQVKQDRYLKEAMALPFQKRSCPPSPNWVIKACWIL